MKKILLLICSIVLFVACQQDYVKIDMGNDDVKEIKINSRDGTITMELNDESKKILDVLDNLKYEKLLKEDLKDHPPISIAEIPFTIGVTTSDGRYTFYLTKDKVYLLPKEQDEAYEFLIATHEDVNTLIEEFNDLQFDGGPLKVGKPVIYIYPEEKMSVQVKIKPEEIMTISYPEYKSGWQVTASPDGTLDHNNHQYAYLFWEGEIRHNFEFDEGFIVKNEETVTFLEDKLDILGLDFREKNDFITYWLPDLLKHPYNKVKFLTDEVDDMVELEIQPQPQSIIRVYMIFEGLQSPEKIDEQDLQLIKRTGYTVVEWGGIEIK